MKRSSNIQRKIKGNILIDLKSSIETKLLMKVWKEQLHIMLS